MARLQSVCPQYLSPLLLLDQLSDRGPRALRENHFIQRDARRDDRESGRPTPAAGDNPVAEARGRGTQCFLQALRENVVLLDALLCHKGLDSSSQLDIVLFVCCTDKVYKEIGACHAPSLTIASARTLHTLEIHCQVSRVA